MKKTVHFYIITLSKFEAKDNMYIKSSLYTWSPKYLNGIWMKRLFTCQYVSMSRNKPVWLWCILLPQILNQRVRESVKSLPGSVKWTKYFRLKSFGRFSKINWYIICFDVVLKFNMNNVKTFCWTSHPHHQKNSIAF